MAIVQGRPLNRALLAQQAMAASLAGSLPAPTKAYRGFTPSAAPRRPPSRVETHGRPRPSGRLEDLRAPAPCKTPAPSKAVWRFAPSAACQLRAEANALLAEADAKEREEEAQLRLSRATADRKRAAEQTAAVRTASCAPGGSTTSQRCTHDAQAVATALPGAPPRKRRKYSAKRGAKNRPSRQPPQGGNR